MQNQTTTEEIKAKLSAFITARPARSAWEKGVNTYALELVESLEVIPTKDTLKKECLNGADNWKQFSEGGSALIYDADIAERLCSPSELKKTRNGERQPNSRDTWIDCQARALGQAFWIVQRAFKSVSNS